MSQVVFGELGGVKANAQGKYENGTRFPDAAYLAAVVDAGVDVLYVITGEHKLERADSISPLEARLLEDFRRLENDQRKHTSTMVHALAEMAGRYDTSGPE